MRRVAGHWQEIAREKIEGTDIEARLQALADRTDPPGPIYIFLPRDQILYTDVKISSEDNAAAEIDAAIAGRTPYALRDLEFDWEQNSAREARVAVIARETLNEAEAFATARGLAVAGFSALADPADFPRLPDFGGVAVDLLSDADEPTADATPTFTTGRSLKPLPAASDTVAAAASEFDQGPVVNVDDPTPVMQLPESDLPPLDPGSPLPRVQSEPRVITDVGAASASNRAASLTATPPVNFRRQDRALPTPALAAIAALLAVGIAIIIWSILPTTPVTSDLASPSPQVEGPLQPTVTTKAPPTDPALSNTPPTAVVLDAMLADPPEISRPPVVPARIADRPTQIALASLPTDIIATGPEIAPTIATERDKRPDSLIGVEDAAPAKLAPNGVPLTETSRGITIAALDGIVPKTDAVALPGLQFDPAAIFDADPPSQFSGDEDVAALPEASDALGLEETVDDDPMNIAGVQPEIIAEPEVPAVAEDPFRLTPTALARALPDRAPRARPAGFTTRIERQNYGGRTLAELRKIRPGARPASAQIEALVALASRAPSDLAIEVSAPPRAKPQDFDAIVAATQVQREAERQAEILALRSPDTTAAIEAALAEDTAAEEAALPQSTPTLVIPSSASVARQATLEDAIRLNRVNLVGVYGLASDRRALVRLPSGRYVKVKVGDRVDGGTVASISESELRYTKRGKTIALRMPKG